LKKKWWVLKVVEVKWIKISTGFPDNRKIKQIRKLPNGDTIALLWVFLMCLAGETNEDGMIYFTPEIPYTEEMLADQFDIEINTVRLGLSTFQRFGMIDIVDDIMCLPSWEKWQSTDALATIREQTRKRVAKHREKQKQIACNVTGNVTVTEGNAIDKDKEEDKERDKDNKKKNKKEEALSLLNSLLPDYLLSETLKAKMIEWVTYKAERKDFYTEQGMKALLRQVENNRINYDEGSVVNLIDECMSNNYKGIIFDKLKTARKDVPKAQQDETPEFLKKWSV
jgi:predicted phage replisome organizer